MIASRIYDKYDNTAKGVVIFEYFAQVPSLPTTTTLLSGNIWYNESLIDMENALMEIFDFVGTLNFQHNDKFIRLLCFSFIYIRQLHHGYYTC
ncbi:MAG: hypothetical protein R2764_19355 [Bacteroidales bacterium]